MDTGIGITDDHEALRLSARRFLESRCPPTIPRGALDVDEETLPPFWDELAEMGWLGLHIAADHGGQGFGLPELAVVLEEMGRAMAPGPFLPTALAAALVTAGGTEEQRASLLPRLMDGSTPAAVAVGNRPDLLLGGQVAQLFVLPVPAAERERWCVLERSRVTVAPVPSLDPTRRLAIVDVDALSPTADDVLPGIEGDDVGDLAAVLLAAECAGGAAWCLDTAAAYAKVREQFGRPIGQFQAIKHRCADMLVAVEQARAAAWDAAVAPAENDQLRVAAATAGAIGPEAFFLAAKACIQLLGGLGFTWEHDAHLYLRRATTVRQLLGASWRGRACSLAMSGARRRPALDLPEEADDHRAAVRAFLGGVEGLDAARQRAQLVEDGYLVPEWPRPWGRGAGAVEQLVIDEEFRSAGVVRPHVGVGSWALPTLMVHGTPEQQQRWIPPTLAGELTWCQLFSEPGAGSDLASLSTKAVRTERGWLLSGQKVWTTMAHMADWGICVARTNAAVPKHDGITYFIVDMHATGIDVRPLRELTGESMFNEVFLADVFVQDDCVVGEVDGGWNLARTTLANERVAIGGGSAVSRSVEDLLRALADMGSDADPILRDAVGGLVVESQTLALLGLRTAVRAVSGAAPGPESSVRKLLGAEHEQRVQELALTLRGPRGAVTGADGGGVADQFLFGRCLTIAGGTSEVQRNVVAERLLGLPRDP
jgi:3-oxochol-4-en-24-oyl-CoA dehydrogenase